MPRNEQAPTIVKRKKVVSGGGHHGGAWKVAYADFVTAMMAFFMLMWLLNATTETQRKGLADYFSPTIAVARVSGGGDGAFGGESLFSENTLAQNGRGGITQSTSSNQSANASTGASNQQAEAEQEDLEEAQAGLLGRGGESLVEDMALEHVVTRLTDEGLVIEIFDLEGRPLFDGETDRPTEIMQAISVMLVEAFGLVTNRIAIASHSASFPVVIQDNPAWGLTTRRAEQVRSLFEAQGLPAARVKQLSGFGQQDPAMADQMDIRNNRIVATLLRESAG